MSTPSHQSLEDALTQFAKSDLARFNVFFRNMRKAFPQEAIEACLLYIAAHGVDHAGQQMAFWLSSQAKYFHLLFTPSAIPKELAVKVVTAMRKADPRFFPNFMHAIATAPDSKTIMHALGLLTIVGDCSALLPMLRKLARHDDPKVRAKTAKVLCELRPNRGLVERQMVSEDHRVRANAVEALWHAQCPDKEELFRAALTDPHHRVITNGLVGLYLLQDVSAFPRMVDLASHPAPLFRAAMAWALGYISDPRGIPILERLSHDPETSVKRRALLSLVDVQTKQLLREETELATQEALAAALLGEEIVPVEPSPAKPVPEPAFVPSFASI